MRSPPAILSTVASAVTAAVPRTIWLTRSDLSGHASAIRLKEIPTSWAIANTVVKSRPRKARTKTGSASRRRGTRAGDGGKSSTSPEGQCVRPTAIPTVGALGVCVDGCLAGTSQADRDRPLDRANVNSDVVSFTP